MHRQNRMQRSLPSRYYTTPEIFRREQELIFAREWFCAGREEDIPAPGDCRVVDLTGESVLVVRSRQGELRAHYNVCRHRGARLCGTARETDWNIALTEAVTGGTIRCPYHQWTYSLEGELLGAPFLKDDEYFKREDLSLYPVALDCWGGFFFVKLDLQDEAFPQGVRAQIGTAVERTIRYPLQDLRS